MPPEGADHGNLPANGERRVGEAKRLQHINLFSLSTMKKCVFNVKLSNAPLVREMKGEKDLNCCGFHD